MSDQDLSAIDSSPVPSASSLNQLSGDRMVFHYPSEASVRPAAGSMRYNPYQPTDFIEHPVLSSSNYANDANYQFVSTPDDDGDLPIHIAVAKEQYDEVSTLLHIMSRLNLTGDAFNDLRQTPLHIAVVTGNHSIVALLQSHGLSPCAPDRHGNTAVHLAAKCGTKECLNSLLDIPEAEEIINSHNYDGFCPMHLAVFRKDLNIIKALVCKNADVDAQDGTSGRSPLFHAVENGFEEVVEILLAFGANVNLPNFGGVTPLVVATDRGNQTITSMLISRGAMMNCREDL